jgi:hypothetical protein
MRFGSRLAVAILAPFPILSFELLVDYHFKLVGEAWFYAELTLPMIVGLFCLWRLPVSKMKRGLLTAVFVPVGIGALVYYALWFGCTVFGDCL